MPSTRALDVAHCSQHQHRRGICAPPQFPQQRDAIAIRQQAIEHDHVEPPGVHHGHRRGRTVRLDDLMTARTQAACYVPARLGIIVDNQDIHVERRMLTTAGSPVTSPYRTVRYLAYCYLAARNASQSLRAASPAAIATTQRIAALAQRRQRGLVRAACAPAAQLRIKLLQPASQCDDGCDPDHPARPAQPVPLHGYAFHPAAACGSGPADRPSPPLEARGRTL